MNTRVSPLHTAAVLATALLSQPLAAAEPVAATPPAASEAAGSADLRAVLEASAEATRAATAYLESEDLLAETLPPAPLRLPCPRRSRSKPGPDDTVISCDGGTYVDGNKGILGLSEKRDRHRPPVFDERGERPQGFLHQETRPTG